MVGCVFYIYMFGFFFGLFMHFSIILEWKYLYSFIRCAFKLDIIEMRGE